VEKRESSAWALSRRYKLSPNPIDGKGATGDRLELAWDGHRVLVCRAGKDVRIFSADFREWTKSFPQVCLAMTKLDCKSAVVDGFLCALDERAHPSFEGLREYVKKPTPKGRVAFAAWDVLAIDDHDLRAEPLVERVGKLAALFSKCKEPLVLSQPLEGSPLALLESLDALGVRGLVARAPNATYETPASCIGAVGPIEWNRSLSAPPKVTNADKVLYPQDGITKTDIARYYDDVSEPLLRAMRDRPVVCQRWPDGIDDFTWYQHRMPPRAPDYLRAVWIEGNRRVVIETREGLLWMVNQAALTFHGWSSRVASLTSPDWVILDLDPGENTKWETVIDVALALRKLLEMLELPSVPKTSGQKGLHILVPIAKGHTVAQTHELAYRMAILVQRLYPNEVSLEAQTETRKGRLYLDHLQNFMGKSLVLPYSLRAANGAPASTPLEWGEVTKKLDPKVFGFRTMRARLDAKGDLAAPITEGTAQLAKAIARLK
jgi:DNA ligase D-like protein (predicted polymerase)